MNAADAFLSAQQGQPLKLIQSVSTRWNSTLKQLELFEDYAKSLLDSSRARLLKYRLEPVAHERFVHYILPDNPKETVEIDLTQWCSKLPQTLLRRAVALASLKTDQIALRKTMNTAPATEIYCSGSTSSGAT